MIKLINQLKIVHRVQEITYIEITYIFDRGQNTVMKFNSYLAVGLASVGIFTGAGVASAATLTSELSISGIVDATGLGAFSTGGAPLTSFEFEDIDSTLDGTTGEFLINDGTGPLFTVFDPTPFQGGTIKNLPINGQFAPVDDFLDFSFDANSGVDTMNNATFDLDTIGEPTQLDTGIGVTTSFSVTGVFETDQGDFDGVGTFSADISYDAIDGVSNFNEYIDFLSVPGNTIERITFSADFVVEQEVAEAVPEASNLVGLLGLGLLGGTLISRKNRKKVKV